MAKMNNGQVLDAFVKMNNDRAESTNLYIAGNKLVNFQTVIAQYTENGLVVNTTRYSNSTSKIQYQLKRILEQEGRKYSEVQGIPEGTSKLSA